MEISVLEIALQKINKDDNIPDALIISVRDAVLEIFCHGQLNCSETENEIFKMDLISLNQQSRKEYITNLSNFLIEKKDLESPGYLNYFYDKVTSTLSAIYEYKGTIAIGIAIIILGAVIVDQEYNIDRWNGIVEGKVAKNNSFREKLDSLKKNQRNINNNLYENRYRFYDFTGNHLSKHDKIRNDVDKYFLKHDDVIFSFGN